MSSLLAKAHFFRQVISVIQQIFVSLASALNTSELSESVCLVALPQLAPEVFNNSVIAVSRDQPVRGCSPLSLNQSGWGRSTSVHDQPSSERRKVKKLSSDPQPDPSESTAVPPYSNLNFP